MKIQHKLLTTVATKVNTDLLLQSDQLVFEVLETAR